MFGCNRSNCRWYYAAVKMVDQSEFCHSATAPTGGFVQLQIHVTEITTGKESFE